MKIIDTADGSQTIVNSDNVLYHSKHGALAESLHVFINSGLNYVAASKNKIKVLEFGFGTGLNAFLSYKYSIENGINIYYTGLENQAIPSSIYKELHYANNDTEQAVFTKLHASPWNQNISMSSFLFRKDLISFEAFTPSKKFDLIYYDTFAPSEQAELWEISMLKKCYDSLMPGGVWISYCAKGQVKRNLKFLGFEVQSLPGPIGKREITRAIK